MHKLIKKPLISLLDEFGVPYLDSEPYQIIQHLLSSYDLELSLDDFPVIAGGSLVKMVLGKNLDLSDIDIFCRNADQFQETLLKNKEFKIKHNSRTKTSHAYMRFKLGQKYYDVQLVNEYFHKSVNHLFGTFDWHVCQFATDGQNVVYTQRAYDSLINRSLDRNTARNLDIKMSRYIKYSLLGLKGSPELAKSIYVNTKGNMTSGY